MLQSAKRFWWIILLVAGVPAARGFSLLDPVIGGNTWQVATIDSITPGNSAIYYGPDLGYNRNPVYWNLAYEIYFKVDEVKREGDVAQKIQ